LIEDSPRPRLSVVVTIVDGHEAVEKCLLALAEQKSPPSLEVIVPYDDSVASVGDLAARFGTVRFLSMGAVETTKPLATPAGQHELYDRRRAVGLSAATGELVGILEDRGIPEAEWAAKVDRLQAALPHAVIGGAVECGVDAPLNWALFFCDYGRYQLPFVAGPREYVTDVNISYEHRVLADTRELWKDRYHETTVHWELERRGETLYLTPDFVVWQHRQRLRLGAVLRERFEWGRLFAYTRARECGLGRRAAYAAMSPLLPFLLVLRHTRMQVDKRVRLGQFVRVLPLVVLLLAAWSMGELIGYVTARP
jgi:hypothetical protein